MNALYWIAGMVERLKPGEWVTVSWSVLRDVPLLPGYSHPADRVMENVVGSAYEVRWNEDPVAGDVTFSRLREALRDGLRTYVSPDRRHWFEQTPKGLWRPLEKEQLERARATSRKGAHEPEGF